MSQAPSAAAPRTATHPPGPSHGARASLWALPLGALGVVYGDIGTSPLYAFRECITLPHGVAATEANVLGLLSLFFWALLFVITFKYLVFVLRADNGGEGGTLALMSLVITNRSAQKKSDR